MRGIYGILAVALLLFGAAASPVLAAARITSTPCPRPAEGSVATAPVELFSSGGALNVSLDYHTTLDDQNRTLFCFTTPDGAESPTLHVKPGDTLNITLTNKVPAMPASAPTGAMSIASDVFCGSSTMTDTSVNMHFHGTNTAPVCHSDETIHTLVNSGTSFVYSVTFPADEPSGLYWYHPHVHGIAEAALLGGATGLIVVDGIENLQPAVAGLPTRYLTLRDQVTLPGLHPGQTPPSWDVSVNYVPIIYPESIPAVLNVRSNRKEFWRVANTSADTIYDVQLVYDGVVQSVGVVALDGVATGSQNGTGQGTIVTKSHLLLPPGARAEFIVTTPTTAVRNAILQTLAIDGGPTSDDNPQRTLAVLHVLPATPPKMTEVAAPALPVMPARHGAPVRQRFAGLHAAPVTTQRLLYFSEFVHPVVQPLPNDSDVGGEFYITVDGQTPTLFDPANPPAIVTHQGTVEQWTIENRTMEVHEFHLHQTHFELEAVNNVAVAAADRQFLDTVQVPYWTGTGPYPSVTITVDFRGDIVGDFLYHCHILGHEDNGMMAIIRVLPAASAPTH